MTFLWARAWQAPLHCCRARTDAVSEIKHKANKMGAPLQVAEGLSLVQLVGVADTQRQQHLQVPGICPQRRIQRRNRLRLWVQCCSEAQQLQAQGQTGNQGAQWELDTLLVGGFTQGRCPQALAAGG